MCSNILGTILWQRKHGRPHKFLQVGTSLNNFKHERKKAPLPMKKMAHKKRKKASHMKEKAPVRGKSTLHYFSMGEVECPETHALVPPPGHS